MARGAWKGILKDDVDLSGCTIKDGQQVRFKRSQGQETRDRVSQQSSHSTAASMVFMRAADYKRAWTRASDTHAARARRA